MTGTDELLPGDTAWPWSGALVVGPPLAGKGVFLIRLLAAGLDEGEGALLLTTDESAADRFDRYPMLDRPGVRIVDATGTPSEDPRVRSVNSPADLTGLGLAFDEAMTELREAGYRRVRVGLDALTTLEVYTESDRVARFVHVLEDRISTAGAVGLFVVHGVATDLDLQRHVDAHIEFRERAGDVEFRVDDLAGVTEWYRYDPDGEPRPASTSPDGVDRVAVESLADLVAAVDADRLTLTVVNDEPDTVDRLAPLFDGLQVEIRAATLDVTEPTSAVLLHRGGDLLASQAVPPLLAAAERVDWSSPDVSTGSPVLDAATRALYAVDTDRRSGLVATSRLVEMNADRVGNGTLHAGFQHLSRLARDDETLRTYQRLAAAGVDVHLYGTVDADVPGEFTLHGAPASELERAWIVAFDGGGNPQRMGGLVAFEVRPDRYEGFWTYQPELVAGLVDYLTTQYGSQVVEPSV